MAVERLYSLEESVRLGKELYEAIPPQVIDGSHGLYIMIDVESGDYEIDADDMVGYFRLVARRPEGQFFTMRIGHRGAVRTGARLGMGEL